MADLFTWLFHGLPWWAAGLVVIATFAVSAWAGGRLPPWAGTLLVSVRVGAFAALRKFKWPKITVEPPSAGTVSDGGQASDAALPPQTFPGRTPEQIAADERAGLDSGG